MHDLDEPPCLCAKTRKLSLERAGRLHVRCYKIDYKIDLEARRTRRLEVDGGQGIAIPGS